MAPGGAIGGYVRLAFRALEPTAWFWAGVVGPGIGLVATRAHDVRIPQRGTEIRTDGIWAALTCETPMEHWSVGLECFGASFDDPDEAWGDERGDLVPLGLDLEWEASAPPEPNAHGYDQWCSVHGEVLLGDDRIDVDAVGSRSHEWGPPQGIGGRVAVQGRPFGADASGLVVAHRAPVKVPGMKVEHGMCVDPPGWVSSWVGA